MNRHILLTVAGSLLGLASCTSPNFSNIPNNGYISHLQPARTDSRGFASFWSTSSCRPAEGSQAVYIKPVSLDHYVPSSTAAASSTSTIALKNYFTNQLRSALAAADSTNSAFHLVSSPGAGVCTMEVAILSYAPTNIKGKALTTATDNLVGGLAGYLVSNSEDSGSICMGAKFYDPNGKLVMEVADWERGEDDKNQSTQFNLGQYSFNLRDFQKSGYARSSINTWVAQLTSLFAPSQKPAPWYQLAGQ